MQGILTGGSFFLQIKDWMKGCFSSYRGRGYPIKNIRNESNWLARSFDERDRLRFICCVFLSPPPLFLFTKTNLKNVCRQQRRKKIRFPELAPSCYWLKDSYGVCGEKQPNKELQGVGHGTSRAPCTPLFAAKSKTAQSVRDDLPLRSLFHLDQFEGS